MPPGWGEFLAGLGSAAGYVVAVSVLVLLLVGFIRGDLVPGWVHRREIARADAARKELDDERAKDEAAAAAAAIAERAAAAVLRVQQLGDTGSADEPR